MTLRRPLTLLLSALTAVVLAAPWAAVPSAQAAYPVIDPELTTARNAAGTWYGVDTYSFDTTSNSRRFIGKVSAPITIGEYGWHRYAEVVLTLQQPKTPGPNFFVSIELECQQSDSTATPIKAQVSQNLIAGAARTMKARTTLVYTTAWPLRTSGVTLDCLVYGRAMNLHYTTYPSAKYPITIAAPSIAPSGIRLSDEIGPATRVSSSNVPYHWLSRTVMEPVHSGELKKSVMLTATKPTYRTVTQTMTLPPSGANAYVLSDHRLTTCTSGSDATSTCLGYPVRRGATTKTLHRVYAQQLKADGTVCEAPRTLLSGYRYTTAAEHHKVFAETANLPIRTDAGCTRKAKIWTEIRLVYGAVTAVHRENSRLMVIPNL